MEAGSFLVAWRSDATPLVVAAQTFVAFSIARGGCSQVNATSELSNIVDDWKGTREVHEKMEPRKCILLQSVRLVGAVGIES